MTQRVLFICLGNICRSPLAQGVFEHHVAGMAPPPPYSCDSAGTGAYHVDELPHAGSINVAAAHGIDISRQRARRLLATDADAFDCLVAMDTSNLDAARRITGRRDVLLMRSFDPTGDGEVPDPWGGGPEGFLEVYRILDRCMPGFIEYLSRR